MTLILPIERIFALSAFEGLRLIRVYVSKHENVSLDELLKIIEHVEADAGSLDLEASLYLHGIVDTKCPLDGDGFYQACISAIVTKHRPTWCKAMRQGRVRFLDSLDANDRDIFIAAGLAVQPPSAESVNWWDAVAGFARLITDIEKMEQARQAEQLTMNYEIQRLRDMGISKIPEWKGLDDNFAGYDVLSYEQGEFGLINRMIEVKSTTASPLRFILTRNEWDQALKAGTAYIFHVWDMAKVPPVLYERTSTEIAPHIPNDNEKGKWKTAEIPLAPL